MIKIGFISFYHFSLINSLKKYSKFSPGCFGKVRFCLLSEPVHISPFTGLHSDGHQLPADLRSHFLFLRRKM